MSCLSTRIADHPLSYTEAWEWLSASDGQGGAVLLFSGQLRDEGGTVGKLFLEHYPGMAEKVLAEIAAEVAERWPVLRVLAWHRVGEMRVGDDIVLVGVSAGHRGEAFQACECLMDRVKTGVPLWKKLSGEGGGQWVDARARDLDAAARWQAPPSEDEH